MNKPFVTTGVSAMLFSALLTLSYSCEEEKTVYNLCPEPQVKKAGFSGEDITAEVEIVRDRNTRTATITIAEDGEWEVYAGPADDRIDMSAPVLTGTMSGTYTLAVADTCRVYFHVITPNGAAIMAERVMPSTGVRNLRDLGGYRTTDGRYVKWGRFLRSEALSTLVPADIEYLENLPLISVVDFRGSAEGNPDIFPGTVQNRYSLELSDFDAIPNMQALYRQLVVKEVLVEQYRLMFEYLSDEQNVPLLFHCTAGKDRTGVAAALILFALGVDEETVFEDFMLTNTCFAGVNGWTVERSWLQESIDTMNSTYGSIENFLTETLGVDLEAFREKFLY